MIKDDLRSKMKQLLDTQFRIWVTTGLEDFLLPELSRGLSCLIIRSFIEEA